MRSEAGLNIQRAPGRAQITIEALPASYLARNSLQAACFVAPNVSSWSEYQANRTGR
jgi:hypothetical protein